MATPYNLTEASVFTANVRSLDIASEVKGATIGSPNDGDSNSAHKDLTDRTKWLNDNKGGKAGGNAWVGKQAFDITSQKYVVGTQFNDASNFNFELTHIGARFSSLDDWTSGNFQQKTLFTFPAGSERIVTLKLYAMLQYSFITNPRISLINTAVKLPASGSGEKVFMIGKLIGANLSDGEVASTDPAPNVGALHLLQYTVGADSAHDYTPVTESFRRNGMFILKEDRLVFRDPRIGLGSGNNLRDIHINAEAWGLPV